MPPQHDKAKRWRPRFSVRTLVVFVTLVCVYFGCWEITKRWGLEGLDPSMKIATRASCPMPFVIAGDGFSTYAGSPYRVHRNYYFWFFRPVFKLPYVGTTTITEIPNGARLRQAIRLEQRWNRNVPDIDVVTDEALERLMRHVYAQ